jgi:branched-chain amino acid transport system permease protein
MCAFGIEAIAMVLIGGYAGRLSLAQAALMGVGAYGFVLLGRAGLPAFAAAILVILVGIVSGVGLTFPALRLRGDYFAIATLGIAEVITVLEQTLGFTGSVYGLSSTISLASGVLSQFIVDVAILLVVFCGAWRITRSPIAVMLRGMGVDEDSAKGCGINPTRLKFQVFVVSSGLAALGGVLYAQSMQYVQPSLFDFDTVVVILTIFVLGGARSLVGGIVASIGYVLAQQLFAGFGSYEDLIFGALIVVVLPLRVRLEDTGWRLGVAGSKMPRLGAAGPMSAKLVGMPTGPREARDEEGLAR